MSRNTESILAALAAFLAWAWIAGLWAVCYWIEPWHLYTVQIILFIWGGMMPVLVIGAFAVVRTRP